MQQELGVSNFVIFDENKDVGGTWLVNKYPGCACDIESHLYSYSFEPNPSWSEKYSRQPEIWRYLKDVAEKHNVLKRVRLGSRITKQEWMDAMRKWKLTVCDVDTGTTHELYFDLM